jgi:hypothetical protein
MIAVLLRDSNAGNTKGTGYNVEGFMKSENRKIGTS